MRLAALLAGTAAFALATGGADTARDKLIVETVLRLESFDYGTASEKVKGAIGRYLEANRGSDEYFSLVERFEIAAETESLAALAASEPPDARAAALFVKIGGEAAIVSALQGDGGKALIGALGTVNDPVAAGVLSGVLLGDDAEMARLAARSLAASSAGEAKLIELAKAEKLPVAVRGSVALALAGSANPKVRAEAAEILPVPSALGGETLPPVGELAKRRGDAKKGEAVYLRSCFTCHKIGERGIDFGPALTEIGDKLAREALYTAILDPNEAISFGYEGFEVKTTEGATLIGYLSSESDVGLAMKVAGGALVEVPAAEVGSKTPLSVSLMPSNLQATMSVDDLVDLVEYLVTLRKK